MSGLNTVRGELVEPRIALRQAYPGLAVGLRANERKSIFGNEP